VTPPIPVVVMAGPVGRSPAEAWVAAGRRAAADDLIGRLRSLDGVTEIVALAADPAEGQALAAVGAHLLAPLPGPFHFGRQLASIIEQLKSPHLAYFGGASAPLLPAKEIQQAFDRVGDEKWPVAVVNNLHSSDWAVFNHAGQVAQARERLPSDNALGWVLSRQEAFAVDVLPPSAASRVDIDTPADLLMIAGHPALGGALRRVVETAPAGAAASVAGLRRLLSSPAQTLAIIGRLSPQVWAELDRLTQIWVRVFSEERGMVASQRLARHQVRSLIGELVNAWGPAGFLQRLGGMCGGVLWDTRVWLGLEGGWPSASDRFASDLGLAESIHHSGLRALTQAAIDSHIPVVLGGHGVVSGGLLSLLESSPDLAATSR
jgi:hypothetical protein